MSTKSPSPDGPSEGALVDKLVAAWGLLGVLALLGDAVYRLARVALGAFAGPLTAPQWAALLAWTAFAAYAEGYRAFHKAFSPRVALRVHALSRGRYRRYALVAPLFCMALVGATRRRMLTSWSIVLMVVGLITLLRRASQPTRGIVDAGVVVALALGTASVLWHTARAFAGKPPEMSGDFPGA